MLFRSGADGDRTDVTYDYKSRLQTRTVRASNLVLLTTTNAYDQYHLTSVTDPYGRKTLYTEYDTDDRVKTMSVELIGEGPVLTSRSEYDAEGNMTASTDPENRRTETDYDGRGRRRRR